MSSFKYQSVVLAFLVFSCHLFVPMVECHRHQQNDNGIAVLLAAGLLAKLLHHKHEEHHIHIPVPVHHEHHEHHGHHGHHHGSGTTRILVHHPAPFNHLYGGAMAASHMHPSRVVYSPPAARYPVPSPNSMPF